MKKRVQIAIILPLDQEYARRVILGALQFASAQNWIIEHFHDDENLLSTLGHWQPTGIIGAVSNPDRLDELRELGVPYVDVSGEPIPAGIPQVTSDDTAIGSLVAQHLLQRGFAHFASASCGAYTKSEARETGFRNQVSVSASGEISVYRDASPAKFSHDETEIPPALLSWVSSLTKPNGVMASDDALARQIVHACHQLEIRIPEDVAVVGCGNDEIICRMTTPPLSSVSLPAERIGLEAATLLDGLMSGETSPTEPMVLPVSNVVTRKSTDVVSVPDPDVAAALRFIRAHSGEWIGVREVLLAVSINRRSLERKFRQYIGRSPLEEIRRIRMEIAKDLLSRTDLAMPIVARRAGFSEAKQLSLMFHNELKITQTAYRRKFRVPGEVVESEEA